MRVSTTADAGVEPSLASPSDLAEFAISSLRRADYLAPSSFERLTTLMRRYASFVELAPGSSLAAPLGPEHAGAFIEASSHSGFPPSVSTMHLRRSAIRLLCREVAKLGIALEDPTADLRLPPKSRLPFRPLSDDEVALCRSFSHASLTATREPAAWALSEASGRASELPYIRVRDVDLDTATVYIGGGAKTAPRQGTLTEWGRVRVSRRVDALRREGQDALLICSNRGNRASSRASAYDAIRATLERAGLGREPDVRPNSLVAWRGASARRDGATIDEVARMLGIRSLDAAASFVGWEWMGEGP